MWKVGTGRVAISLLFLSCFSVIAWFNAAAQREQVRVNTTGIVVTGSVSKRQTFQSSGRGNSWVNIFHVIYFDEPVDAKGESVVGEPLVLEVHGTCMVPHVGSSTAKIGEFHSYDIENVPDTVYDRTEEGSRIPIVYLPGEPEKVWLKETIDGKTKVNPGVPGVLITMGLFLAIISYLDFATMKLRFRERSARKESKTMYHIASVGDQQRLSLLSPTWKLATKFLKQQLSLRDELELLFSSLPISTMYADEQSKQHQQDILCFQPYVSHVRGVLSISPRTILRAAIDGAFGRIASTNHDACHELIQLLEEETKTTLASHRMHDLVESVSRSTPGKCYTALQRARKDLERTQQSDVNSLCEKIRAKLEDTTGKVQPAEILEGVRKKHKHREEQLNERVEHLEKQLTVDQQYAKHSKIQHLWHTVGAQHVWDRYIRIDKQLSKSKTENGIEFESRHPLVFAMIVQSIVGTEASAEEFSYACNLPWWKGSEHVGEIDLVVLRNDKVVAVCEMKRSAFELSVAFRQHKTKIESTNAGECTIGKRDSPYQIGPGFQLFVTTLLPEGCMLGAEPKLANAIGDGLRNQGHFIATKWTKERAAPVVEVLLGSSDEHPDDDAIQYLGCVPEDPSPPEGEFDALQLREFVKNKVGCSLSSSLSPLGCLRQSKDNIFILV